MSTFEVELAVLVFVLVVGIGVFIWTHRRLVGMVYDRQKAMDGYVKAVTRDKLTVIREAQKSVEQAQLARDEARQVLERVEAHMSDPDLRRLLGRG